ncbi:MAG: hypothetical protein MJZ72_04185 [Bacteroidales bacterium]|nr:hypothetical protein [Bacteroidales bacterium]
MKKTLIAIFLLSCIIFSSCGSKDAVVAEVYHNKLYRSQVEAQIPQGISEMDSSAIAQLIIDEWIRQQIILHEATQTLSFKELNFENEIKEYRENLIANAYYNRITSDTTSFQVSDEELNAFLKKYENRYTVDREIIKINYVKTNKNCRLIPALKTILFDEEKRQEEKGNIENLCADSIEYFLEDNTWLYLEDIQNELPLSINDKEAIKSENQYIETEDDDYHYIIVLLDYKSKRTINETEDEIAAAKQMLQQQKKQKFIKQTIEELYQKALTKGQVARRN